jgi:glycosyltransferase involved in cell wall biosynthesis
VNINVSIIICCYNGAARIRCTIDHLAKQVPGYLNFEVILVDNNSSDDTTKVANEKWEELLSPFPLRVIEEKQSGLSHARKAGVLAAFGEVIIFCDDDNWLAENYLTEAYNLIKSNDSIFGVCGYCEPVADVILPNWFAEYSQIYACGLPQIKDEITRELHTLRGAGMAIRSDVIQDLYASGVVHFSSDRKGQSLSSGGDDEISLWLRTLGGKLLYSENLKLKHFMEQSRLNVDYRNRLEAGIRMSTKSLKRSTRIMSKSIQKINKRDCINIFRFNDDGYISRLKFGFYGKNNIYKTNMLKLQELKLKYSVK